MIKTSISSLAKSLSAKGNISESSAETFIRQMFDVAQNVLQEDKQLKVKWLGTFKVTAVKDRESVDVNTGERIVISGRDKISFTPDNILKEIVNKPFAQFETVVVNDGVDFTEIDNRFSETELSEEAMDVPADATACKEETQDESEEAASLTSEKSPESQSVTSEPHVEQENPKQETSIEPVVFPIEATDKLEQTTTSDVVVIGADSHVENKEEKKVHAEEVVVVDDAVNETIEDSNGVSSAMTNHESIEESNETTNDVSNDDLIDVSNIDSNDHSDTDSTVDSPTDDADEDSDPCFRLPRYWAALGGALLVAVMTGVPWLVISYTQMKSKYDQLATEFADFKKHQSAHSTHVQKTKQLTPAPLSDADQIKLKAKEDSARMAQASEAVAKATDIDAKTNANSEPKTSTASATKTETKSEKQPTVQSMQKDEKSAKRTDSFEQYNSDVRVRTGAYRIVGVERTVKVKSGQTLASISKIYLGPGMECYIEALNGASALKEGQSVKIPKLEVKKKKK